MKRTFLVTVALLVSLMAFDIASNFAVSQAFHYWTLNVRTLLAVTGKVTVGDSLRVNKELILPVGSYFTVYGSTIAGIDSFTTTATEDTLAVTGAAAGDLVFIQPYYPAHSTVKDTGSSQYDAFAIAGKIVAGRGKLTPESTLKSAGIYQYFIVRKN